MKIYTRTGDKGTTGLFGGGRVSKHHPRIEAYGTVDEANTFVGAARASMREDASLSLVDEMLDHIQQSLFVLGADLATPPESRAEVQRIRDDDVRWLEESIDRLEADLAPLRNFILPGGSTAGAQLHIGRTVCRRAERLVAELIDDEEEAVSPLSIVYLNRLSDFLFVAARWVNSRLDIPERIWNGGR